MHQNLPMPLPNHQDPIVAIATAPGRGAVGIVRVSGRDLSPLAAVLTGRSLPLHAGAERFYRARGSLSN